MSSEKASNKDPSGGSNVIAYRSALKKMEQEREENLYELHRLMNDPEEVEKDLPDKIKKAIENFSKSEQDLAYAYMFQEQIESQKNRSTFHRGSLDEGNEKNEEE